MAVGQDPRTGKWFFRRRIVLPNGTRRRIFGGGFALRRDADQGECQEIVALFTRSPAPNRRPAQTRALGGAAPGLIYFIGCESDPPTIKIGFTAKLSPAERLRTLQVGCPRRLTVLAYTPGTEAEERSLHRRFATLAIAGEWFRAESPLNEYVRALRKWP